MKIKVVRIEKFEKDFEKYFKRMGEEKVIKLFFRVFKKETRIDSTEKKLERFYKVLEIIEKEVKNLMEDKDEKANANE